MLKWELDLDKFQIEKGRVFKYYDLKAVFKKSNPYKTLDFADFMEILNDYYRFKYAIYLSKTAWLVFEWIRFLCRFDGFVTISYKDVLKTFCHGDLKISKPTFYKCIKELDDVGLIYKMGTHVVEDDRPSTTENAYGIVDMTERILEICDLVEKSGIHHLTVMKIYNIECEYPPETPKAQREEILKRERAEKKAHPPKMIYRLLMAKMNDLSSTFNEFFDFLGSYNSSGKIALSRKIKILERFKYYYDGDFTNDDITDAIMRTMKNTVNGKNPKKENYTFSILRNMEDIPEEKSDNEIANRLSEKASEKLNKDRKLKYVKPSDIVSADEFKKESKLLLTVEGYYRTALTKYKNPQDENGKKLLKAAQIIKHKFDTYKQNITVETNRIKLLEKHGIYEYAEYTKGWNRRIGWCDDEDNDVSSSKVKSLLKKITLTRYDTIK